MSPNAVIAEARRKGLDVIGICDHNATENVAATSAAGTKLGVTVIGGMEITSREEVHVLGLFPIAEGLQAAQEEVYAHLQGENDPEFFGQQQIMDEHDRVIAENDRLLIGSTDLTLGETVDLVHRHSGIAIASHIDRPSFSLISQLGFVPTDLELDGVEVCSADEELSTGDLPVVRSSDAHTLNDIGVRRTQLLVEDATAAEVALAVRGVGGRRILEGEE
jgi:PHP family Zn ribbon phosphoesterase